MTTERKSVTEVILTGALVVAIPIESGDDPETAVVNALRHVEGIRHVSVEERSDVSRIGDKLHVETYVRVTFHLDIETEDPVSVCRARLEQAACVVSMQDLGVADGPYRIESW